MLREDVGLDRRKPFRLLGWQNGFSEIQEIGGMGTGTHCATLTQQWHYHRAVELILIEQGNGERFVADSSEKFSAGDMVVIGGNIPHRWIARGKCAGRALQWLLPHDHGVWDFAEARELKVLTDSRGRGRVVSGNTARELSQMLRDLSAWRGAQRLAGFLTVLARLARAPAAELRPLASPRFAFPASIGHQEAIFRSMSYIVAHHRDGLQQSELLELSGMSRPTFARQFRRHASCSFSAFLNRVRLHAVCRELRESREPIGTIALNHGFNHLSFFNRLFLREVGVNPTDFRNSPGQSSGPFRDGDFFANSVDVVALKAAAQDNPPDKSLRSRDRDSPR